MSFNPSKRHKFGWEVRPSFSVSQNDDRAELLYKIQEHWDCGSIRPDRSDNTLKFEIRRIEDLITKVLPHFREYPLLSSKRREVELFDQICCSIFEKQHLKVEGLTRIVRLAMHMNPSGKRKYSEDEILNSFLNR